MKLEAVIQLGVLTTIEGVNERDFEGMMIVIIFYACRTIGSRAYRGSGDYDASGKKLRHWFYMPTRPGLLLNT